MAYRTLIAAVGLVVIGLAGAVVVKPVFNTAGEILAAPIVPAMFLLWSMFTGGPHGASIGLYQELAAIFVIGVAMWWAIFEACRRLWKRFRPHATATRPPT